MDRCVLVTRPEPDGPRLADRLRRAGVNSIESPLLEIDWLVQDPLPVEGAQALLFTSANGVRGFQIAAGEQALLFDPIWRAPVFAVGDATASVARSAAFENVESAEGDSSALATLVETRLDPAAGPLLHSRGAIVAGAMAEQLKAAGFDLREAVVYETRPAAALTAEAEGALTSGLITDVALFSPRSAETFARLTEKITPSDGLTIWCLSEAVADGLGDGLSSARICIADTLDEDALLIEMGVELQP